MKKGLITSILALTFTGLNAQPQPVLPKLLVTLTIDQLRTDYLEDFSPLYGEKGFKRLMREGKVFRQAEFPYNKPDRASAIATLSTGTVPSIHGIIGCTWMDRETIRPRNCVNDPAYMGNFTDETSAPTALLTSTLADELKIATQNRGLIYSVAPTRDAAILWAGHCANGVFWLNETNGKWCSSTYYGELPWWASQYNTGKSPDFRIKEMEWTPLHPAASYKFLPEWRSDAFKYKMDSDRINKYRRLLVSPLANEEVNLLVEELLDKSTIGRDEVPDMLALTYYGGNYNHKSTQECAMEMQDTYARLDRCIARLLEMLDEKVGLQNVVLCITSTGYSDPEAADIGIYRVPNGEFHMKRCTTLLNMYLMATYGEGQYVEGFHDLQIYLDHKLIEKKQLDLTEIQEKSARFLVQFSGVNKVFSAHQLLLGSWSPAIEKMRNGFHRKHSGDLIVDVLPGWTIIQDNSTHNRVVRAAHIPTPLILFGPNVQAETVRIPVDVERITPTLCGMMRIRAPNGCDATPLE